MLRTSLPLVTLLFVLSCASSNDAPAGGPPIDLRDGDPGVRVTRGYLNVKTLQLLPLPYAPNDDELLVSGRIVGTTFFADSDVIGRLQPAPVGDLARDVWLRLSDRSIHRRTPSDAPPAPPYIPGRFEAKTGLFFPSEAQVIRPVAVP